MKKRTKTLIPLICMSVLCGALIGGNVVAHKYSKSITNFLCGTGDSFQGEEVDSALAKGDLLCEKIASDSIVMLKNNDNVLPIANPDFALNVFGYGATDNGFLLKGIGSGSSTISEAKKVTFLQALEEEGFIYNTEIMDVYNQFTGGRPKNPNGSNVYKLAEPNISAFDGLWESAKDFSDTALFVISRDGGENVGEMPKTQENDSNRTYLEISRQEEEMLNKLKTTFDKVIVILNTTNTMHTGFLNDPDIDGALYVGLPGQSGTRGIAQILSGRVNPSGRTTDIMTYSTEYDPTYKNNEVINNSIAYAEDIYFGYKWYETAAKDGYFDAVKNEFGAGYNGVVQYPFGYGLSYTSFDWELDSISLEANSNLEKDSKINLKVKVTNTGDFEGKDVVELYYTPTYIKGGIEKAETNLLDFAKTALLLPGQSQIVELSFSAYDLASYDAYDKNQNGYTTYEIDKGTVDIKLMNNSHSLNDMQNNTITYDVKDTLIFDKDPRTGKEVTNRFTGDNAYAETPIDGSTAGIGVKYLSRSDFKNTFPRSTALAPNNKVVSKASTYLHDAPYQGKGSITVEEENNLRLFTKENGDYASYKDLKGGGAQLKLNNDLFTELANYNSDKWDLLLNQMSKSELANLVSLGGFHTEAIESIGKKLNYDYDGPAGFNNNTQVGNFNGEDAAKAWTAYPSEALIGCSWNENLMVELGLSMGEEAAATNLNGWYAPGVNLHRSAYTARNYEYYSEDGVLSGKLAAKVIFGAKANGLYCYLKHFAVSEAGPNPKGVNTWLTEQNLRENFLRPFEIAVKEGESNAIMTAFNRVGAVWAGANYAMNVNVLREEWGFVGSLITDWTVGDGIGQMNVRQGVRGGNSLWLNPNTVIGAPLDLNNEIDMYCARNSAKDILYTMIDTRHFHDTFDESLLDGLNKAEVGIGFKEQVFPWWIPVLGVIDAAALGGLIFFAVKFGLTFKKKKEEEAN